MHIFVDKKCMFCGIRNSICKPSNIIVLLEDPALIHIILPIDGPTHIDPNRTLRMPILPIPQKLTIIRIKSLTPTL